MSELTSETDDSFQKAVNVVGQILDNELETNRINKMMSHYQKLCENRGQVVWPKEDDVTEKEVDDALKFLKDNEYTTLYNEVKSYQGLYIPNPE